MGTATLTLIFNLLVTATLTGLCFGTLEAFKHLKKPKKQ